MALALNRPWPARGALRLAYFLPAVVPPVVHAIIWRFLFHPYGLLNRGLETLGLPAVAWLADSRAIVPGFILANLWRFAPYFMVVYLAGLQSISAEYYEAASIDGASPGQQFRHITLPLLRPTILLVVVVSTILMSKIFTSVLIVSNGGPDGASRVLSLFIYQTGFPVSQDGAGVRRIGLSLARHHGLHPGPAPPAPECRPWLSARAPRARLRAGLELLLLTGGALVLLTPILWMLSTSLKPLDRVFELPLEWIPRPPAMGQLLHGLDPLRLPPLLRERFRRLDGRHAPQRLPVGARRVQPRQVPILRAAPPCSSPSWAP